MPKISGQSVISGQFQDSFEISGISGRLWPLSFKETIQKHIRLDATPYNHSSVCMEFLLTFHITIKHVQSWQVKSVVSKQEEDHEELGLMISRIGQNWEITVNWKELQRTGQFGTPWLVNLLLKNKTQEEVQSWLNLDGLLQTVHISMPNYVSAHY